MIKRQLQDVIEKRMFSGKAILVIGARQVGKSTLYKMVLENHNEPVLQLNCDEPEVKEMLTNLNTREAFLRICKSRANERKAPTGRKALPTKVKHFASFGKKSYICKIKPTNDKYDSYRVTS